MKSIAQFLPIRPVLVNLHGHTIKAIIKLVYSAVGQWLLLKYFTMAYKLTAFLDCRLRFYNLRAYNLLARLDKLIVLLVYLKHMHDASILRFAQYHDHMIIIIIIENAHSAGRRTKTTRNALTRAKYLSAKCKGSQVCR